MGAKQKTKRSYQESRARLDDLIKATCARVELQLADLTALAAHTEGLADRTQAMLRSAADDAACVGKRLHQAVDEARRLCEDLEARHSRSLTTAEGFAARLRALTAQVDEEVAIARGRVEACREVATEQLTIAGDQGTTHIAAVVEQQLTDLGDAHDAALRRLADLEAEGRARVELGTAVLAEEPQPGEPMVSWEPDDRDASSSSASSTEGSAETDTTFAPLAPIAAPKPLAPHTTLQPSASLEPTASAAAVAEVATVEHRAPAQRLGSPVELQVSRRQLLASVIQLARSAADGWVHIELVRGLTHDPAATSLRLSAGDVTGGWESHELPGHASSGSRPVATVDAKELLQAIELEPGANDVLKLMLDGDVTIGAVLVLGHNAQTAILSGERHRVEPVELRQSTNEGVVLETLLGRLVLPSRAASSLRSRRASSLELITIDDRPCLSARVAGPTPEISARVVAPLFSPADSDAELKNDRRAAIESPVGQLMGALSAGSSPDELTEILVKGVGYARRRAAEHPALPAGLIAELVRDGTEAMRVAAASNPSLPVSSIEYAVVDGAAAVRAAVASNAQVPPALLLRLAHDDSAQVRAGVARNPAVSPELLALLTDDPNAAVREVVAASAACSVDTLTTLADDAFPSVCAKVAQNPSSPVELLDQLLSIVPEIVLANRARPNVSWPRAAELNRTRYAQQ